MNCEFCERIVPEELDYCPTCKINENKEPKESVKKDDLYEYN